MSSIAPDSLPGFADPVHDAQRTFRATLTAMSRPTLPQHLAVVREGGLRVPEPLTPGVGALLLTLCDEHTPIWLDPVLAASAEVTAWLRFHTAAPLTSQPSEAAVAVASSPAAAPRLGELAQGTDEAPHTSATLIIDASDAAPTGSLVATGPGVNGDVHWDGAGLPDGFLAEWQVARGRFPQGIDVLLSTGMTVRALPRTTELTAVTTADVERNDA